MSICLLRSLPAGTTGAVHCVAENAGVTRATPELSAQEPVISPEAVTRMLWRPLQNTSRPKPRAPGKHSDAGEMFFILTGAEKSVVLGELNVDGRMQVALKLGFGKHNQISGMVSQSHPLSGVMETTDVERGNSERRGILTRPRIAD